MFASEYFNFYYYDYLINMTIVSIDGIGWVTKSHITLNNQCNIWIWAGPSQNLEMVQGVIGPF